MEKFITILQNILDVGGLVVLASLFVYVFITDRQKQKDKDEEVKIEKEKGTAVLKELSTSNANIAESLNLLKTSIDNNTAEYRQHDDRAIQQFSNINEKLIRIENKLNK